MILIINIKLIEISAPAPDSNDKVLMILGVLLGIQQHFPIDGIKLNLMTAKVDKRLYKSSNLLYAVGISEGIVVNLHSQRAAVDNLGHIVLCEGLDAGERPLKFGSHRRRKA